MSERTGNAYRRTSLRNGGRIAGSGVAYGDYSEESMGGCFESWGGVMVRLPHDNVKPEELNGPVRCYKEETE